MPAPCPWTLTIQHLWGHPVGVPDHRVALFPVALAQRSFLGRRLLQSGLLPLLHNQPRQTKVSHHHCLILHRGLAQATDYSQPLSGAERLQFLFTTNYSLRATIQVSCSHMGIARCPDRCKIASSRSQLITSPFRSSSFIWSGINLDFHPGLLKPSEKGQA